MRFVTTDKKDTRSGARQKKEKKPTKKGKNKERMNFLLL